MLASSTTHGNGIALYVCVLLGDFISLIGDVNPISKPFQNFLDNNFVVLTKNDI